MQQDTNKIRLGWREWIALPELNLPAIKAKVDTGAKTSALHAFYVERYQQESVDMVKFLIHPVQKNLQLVVECHSPILDQREVIDSGGHKEMRYVIESLISIGDKSWPIELSLTNRDTMRFRMLLGRRAMEYSAIVEPGASYLNGKLDTQTLYNL
jgi:hypothetical protein